MFTWIETHPVYFVEILLSLLTLVARFAKPGTRLAAFFAALPAFDIVKLVCLVIGIPMPGGFTPAPTAIAPTPAAMARMAKPKPPPSFPTISGAVLFVLSIVVGGCSWFSGKGPATAVAVGDIVACVLEHHEKGETVAEIAKSCEGVAIQDVIEIVEAHKRAMAKDAACAPSGAK